MLFEDLMMRLFLITFVGLFFLQTVVPAQDAKVSPDVSERSAVSTGGLQFFSDTGVFRGPESGLMRLEVFLLVDAKQFALVPEDGVLKAQYDLTLRVVSEDHKTVKSDSWTRNLKLPNTANAQEGQAPHRDRVWLDLPPGKYHLVVEVDDMFGDKSGMCQSWVLVDDLEQDTLLFSDLIFASELKPTEGAGRFVRYNLNVVPNITRRYLVDKSIPLYYEIYNLVLGDDPNRNSFVLEYSLTDSVGMAIKKYPAKRYRTAGASAVQTMDLSTADVKPGIYWVQVAAFDRAGKRGGKQRRRVVLASLKEPTPEMSEQDAAQLRYYKDVRYVAKPQEVKQYERLPQSAQMNFLRQFWKAQDPTPGTPVNERLIQHLQRMHYVETNFSRTNTSEAIDTDRGRVHITYGPPDDIDRNASSAGDKASEVWHYGRNQFIFRDSNGLGVYRLVHSTYPGEVYNPEWQQQTY
jgi:GWxTD domain-containing protein